MVPGICSGVVSRRRKTNGRRCGRIGEIIFDSKSRIEYVGGFRKRKEERRKQAKAEAARLEKAEKKITKKDATDAAKQRYQEVVAYRNALISHFDKKVKEGKNKKLEKVENVKKTEDPLFDFSIASSTSINHNVNRISDDSFVNNDEIECSLQQHEVSSEFYKTNGSVIIETSSLSDWNSRLTQQELANQLAKELRNSSAVESVKSSTESVESHENPSQSKKHIGNKSRVKSSKRKTHHHHRHQRSIKNSHKIACQINRRGRKKGFRGNSSSQRRKT